MRITVIALVLSVLSNITNAQIDHFEVIYASTERGSIKGFWYGNKNGNKSQIYDVPQMNKSYKLGFSKRDSIQRIKVFFYFPKTVISISQVIIQIGGIKYNLTGENILKVANYNHQLRVLNISEQGVDFSRMDASGNAFLDFGSGNSSYFKQLYNQELQRIEFISESKNDLIMKGYKSSIDDMKFDQIPSILFIPTSDSTIKNINNFELSNDRTITFHVRKNSPIDFRLYSIRDVNNNTTYRNSELFQRLQVSNNLSLNLRQEYVEIKRNKLDDDYSLISLNMNDTISINHKYKFSIFSKGTHDGVIKVTVCNTNENYSYHNYSDKPNSINDFFFYTNESITNFKITFVSNEEVNATIDSVIVININRKLKETFYTNNFDYHRSNTGRFGTYRNRTEFIFWYDRLMENIIVVSGFLICSGLMYLLNTKILGQNLI